MAEGRVARLFWRTLDRVDYWITQARLRTLDRAAGHTSIGVLRPGIDLMGVLGRTSG
jgi:hypothetical protein